MRVGDSLKLISFGKDLADSPKFNNWIYNVPSSHNLCTISQVNVNTYRLTIFDNCVFYVDEILKLRNDLGDEVDITVKQIEYDSTNTAQVYSNTMLFKLVVLPNSPTKITKTVTRHLITQIILMALISLQLVFKIVTLKRRKVLLCSFIWFT